jgi:hypothetical protein
VSLTDQKITEPVGSERRFVIVATSMQLEQTGAILGALGAAFIAVGALRFLLGSPNEGSRRWERTATVIGALAICAAFLVQLFAISR